MSGGDNVLHSGNLQFCLLKNFIYMAFRYRITVINPTSTYARSIFHHSSFYLSKNYFLINPSSIY